MKHSIASFEKQPIEKVLTNILLFCTVPLWADRGKGKLGIILAEVVKTMIFFSSLVVNGTLSYFRQEVLSRFCGIARWSEKGK